MFELKLDLALRFDEHSQHLFFKTAYQYYVSYLGLGSGSKMSSIYGFMCMCAYMYVYTC